MIIGLTGSIGSGKGVVADFLKEQGFIYLSLSNELREIAKEDKVEFIRENLQNLGNKLREEGGAGVLAQLVVDKINNQEYKKVVVDGIRNPAEIGVLKTLNNFFLVSVDAAQKIRFERVKERGRESDPQAWDGFLKMDGRDKGEGEAETGQNVRKCMELADFTLVNDGGLEEIQEKIRKLFDEVDRKLPRPDWDEYFVEICRAVARRATCNRGRSGSVIAKNKRLLVTGYVGSPTGVLHCDEVGHQMKTMVHEDGSKTEHCVRTTHAEQNAICQAAKLGISIDGATLYCKMTPCGVCAKMIINSGIKRVVSEKDYHAGRESKELFKKAGVQLEILDKEVESYKNQ